MELRMSRKDGFDGASSIARVISDCAFRVPIAARRSHRVCDQISPSACTCGAPETRP
jgi:hypothetical protein